MLRQISLPFHIQTQMGKCKGELILLDWPKRTRKNTLQLCRDSHYLTQHGRGCDFCGNSVIGAIVSSPEDTTLCIWLLHYHPTAMLSEWQRGNTSTAAIQHVYRGSNQVSISDIQLRGFLGVPDTVSGPLNVPLNYLVILHQIQLKA